MSEDTAQYEITDEVYLHKIHQIQERLKAPKSQYNSFGKYHYRSCEDIVEAAKPLLAEYGYHLTLSDEMIEVGGRVYVKATAAIKQGHIELDSVTANAREAETKKGMDDAQITGAASSYARKYALNGLFAIDDTKDADSTNTHDTPAKEASKLTEQQLKDQTNWIASGLAEVKQGRNPGEWWRENGPEIKNTCSRAGARGVYEKVVKK